MISVAPEDRDALHFLWVDDTSVGFPQIVVSVRSSRFWRIF